MDVDKYNEQVENYNLAVDNENGLSDDILDILEEIKMQLRRIADSLEKRR